MRHAYRKVNYVLEDGDGNLRASFFDIEYALAWQDHLASNKGIVTELYEDTDVEIIEKSTDGSWVKRQVIIRQRLSRKRVPD